jgi:hypothetical protein
MKKFFLLLFCFPVYLLASNGDTTVIRFHNKVDMNSHGNYDVKGKFPDGSKTYRQILMKYTLGCSSTGCSGWDYSNPIQYLKPSGIFDSTVASIDTTGGKHDTTWNKKERIELYELGRVITPYGTYMQSPGSNGYSPSWQHQYWFDVSDFVLFLRDSATIRSFYDGWSSGFSATLDFYFIEGTPPRNVLKLENVYGAGGNGYGYNDPTSFEKNALPKKGIAILPNTKSASFQFTPSGHGFDNDKTAAEFYDESAKVYLNNSKIGDMHIWRDDCGKNPIYPQGGTWIYNRANWCPGTKVNTFSYDITQTQLHPGTTDSLDVDFDPYTYTGNGGASYLISSVFVQYGDNNFNYDASVKDIIAPSTNENYRRRNPTCYGPTIEIKNNGKNTITNCSIKYGLSTGVKTTYTWNGSLAFNQTTQVVLPSFNWAGAVNGSIFEAEITNVNNTTDEWLFDNKKSSTITITPKHETDFVVWFKTNNNPEENSYKFLDWNNNVVYSRSGMTTKNFIYKDTIHLAVGCYTFLVDDTGGDGLSWWANTAAGNGTVYFKNMNGSLIKNFNMDFGSEIRYNFTTSYVLGIKNAIVEDENILIYPNPSSHNINIQLNNIKGNADISVIDITGKSIFQISSSPTRDIVFVNNLAKGIYLVKVFADGKMFTEKVIIE